MADSSTRLAGSKSAGPRGKTARSDSAALIALAAEEGAKAREQPRQPDPQDLAEQNRQSMEAFVQANAAVLDGMAALSAELLSFGNKRLNANIERTQTLAGCDDLQKAFQVQTDFFESAVQQYLEQANNVMTIMTSISTSIWGSLDAEDRPASGEGTARSGPSESD